MALFWSLDDEALEFFERVQIGRSGEIHAHRLPLRGTDGGQIVVSRKRG